MRVLRNTNLILAGVVVLFAVGVLVNSSYAKIDPETAVGIYLFDEGKGNLAKDYSGKGNDGEIFGSKWVDGKFGGALEFDGEEKGSTVFSGPIVSFPDTHVYLGRECCDAARHFDGVIDEAAMFNVVLSKDDIKDIMTTGLANVLAVSSTGKLTTTWGSVKARY